MLCHFVPCTWATTGTLTLIFIDWLSNCNNPKTQNEILVLTSYFSLLGLMFCCFSSSWKDETEHQLSASQNVKYPPKYSSFAKTAGKILINTLQRKRIINDFKRQITRHDSRRKRGTHQTEPGEIKTRRRRTQLKELQTKLTGVDQ